MRGHGGGPARVAGRGGGTHEGPPEVPVLQHRCHIVLFEEGVADELDVAPDAGQLAEQGRPVTLEHRRGLVLHAAGARGAVLTCCGVEGHLLADREAAEGAWRGCGGSIGVWRWVCQSGLACGSRWGGWVCEPWRSCWWSIINEQLHARRSQAVNWRPSGG